MSGWNWIEIAAVGSAVAVGLNLLWTVAFSIWVYNNRNDRSRQETIDDHGNRLTKLETTMGRIPVKVASHEDIERVHVRVGNMRDELSRELRQVGSEVAKMSGAVDGLARTVKSLVDHEMRRGEGR